MPDLSVDFAGIKSPNPFWLASAPPTNSGEQVMRAFDAGWGGAVWKTLGDPIVNISSRLGSIDYTGQRMMGLTNIELITDRPLDVNLREITEVKKRYPGHALIVSLMVESRDDWVTLIKRSEDTGADGLELNFGCPHGMCERGMGSAVGQEPKVLEELVHWVMDAASIPVIAKLTPNITDVTEPAEAACRANVTALSLINTLQSIIGVDLDRLVPLPRVGDVSSHGGFCGPAVKPIALRMLAQLSRDPQVTVPVSGIGGIADWRDAAEFLALGATTVQVCTAVMHYGYRIVGELIDGLDAYLAEKRMDKVSDLVGAAVPAFKEWGELDLNYHVVAQIDADKCIGCQLCHVACHDGAHQCIHLPGTKAIPGNIAPMAEIAAQKAAESDGDSPYRVPWVDETECVGCNLCELVCPVENCITMVERRRAPEVDTWNDRVASGRDYVPGGLRELEKG
ncbi:MAG: NAD-dependent dihydropyrimidine dehydrogenase subunit PreA [Gemmatimonadetes bacterium]|nr:NAD-dependent dihydropyrimidine dehydrogenase subunit PreA [Gemmatimonadota bacterium]